MSRSGMPVTSQTLTGAVRAALGSDHRVLALTRLPGGTKKGAYRLRLDDDSTVVAYVWDDTEDFWPDSGLTRDEADPFAHASGHALFDNARRHLNALDVRTPEVFLSDDTHTYFPADIAIVEDIQGPSLETILHDHPDRAAPIMDRLAGQLGRLHAQTSPHFGRPSALAKGRLPYADSCQDLVLDRALTDLTEAAAREAAAATAHDHLAATIHTLHTAVAPRTRHALIHGELGPDHVLVDARDQPVLIDIEGLMFFDVEWEHVFLRLRYEDHYAHLHRPDLDAARMRLYSLAMHLSLVAGPLRLLDGGYPDRDGMRGIVDHNLRKALDFAA